MSLSVGTEPIWLDSVFYVFDQAITHEQNVRKRGWLRPCGDNLLSF